MLKHYEIGEKDEKGLYEKVWEGNNLEIWVTSNGRFSILDPILNYSAVKSNMRSLETAIFEAQSREGTLDADVLKGENTVLHGLSGRTVTQRGTPEGELSYSNLGEEHGVDPDKMDSLLRDLAKKGLIKEGKLSRTVGDRAYGGWRFLGEGNDYQVWESPSGRRYQVTTKNPEKPYSGIVNEKKLQEEIMPSLKSSVSYQQSFPDFDTKGEITMTPLAEQDSKGKWIR